MDIDWARPLPGFRSVLFDRTDRIQNVHRFYLVSWQPTLLDSHAVVCTYGRKGVWQRVRTVPFPSLEAAWPLIRATVKARLRHKYQVVAVEWDASGRASPAVSLPQVEAATTVNRECHGMGIRPPLVVCNRE